MINSLPYPARGGDILAWAQPVTERLNALADHTLGSLPNQRDRRAAHATTVPGPFEPIFVKDEDEDTDELILDDVGPGFWPHGRDFYSAVTIDSSAKVSSGMIGIEITHASTTSANAVPTAKIIGNVNVPTQSGTIVNRSNTTKTVLPLYMIEDGKIVLDCRCLLSLALRQ